MASSVETGGTVTSDDTSHTPAALTIEVYTTPARTFVSATPPQAPDDEPTWSRCRPR